MNLLRFLLQSSRSIVIVSAIAGAAAGVTGIALIALIQIELARESSRPAIMVWAFAALCLVSASARVIGQVGMVKLGQRAVAELGLHIVRRTLELPLRAFEGIDSSGLLAALTEDVVLIANALVGAPHLCINIPIVITCLAYVGWLSPLVFVCGVGFAAPAIAASVVLSTRGVKALRRARAHQDALVGHFRTLIGGFRELKLHRGRREAFLTESLDHTMASVRGDMVRGLTSFAVAEGWSQLAFFGFIGVLLFAIPLLGPIGRPTLVSAVLIVLYLMSPLDIILTWLPILGRARASLQKVQELIPAMEPHGDGADGRMVLSKRHAFRESVSLEGVTFTYRDRHDGRGFALEPVDLTLRRGEIVIIAGGNGSGKTTLVKLISGLYRPETGIIRLDGRVVDDENREAYRQLFSVVYADGHLFQDFAGLGTASIESRARDGLDRLGLAPQVSIQGCSFSTTDLSQGQRRRLALLGVWLEDRPICILDEWAANQDLSFKEVFYYKLLPELRAAGKALLIISHDESHFDVADRVIRLQDGRLVDESPLAIGGDWARPV
jgi:putative pyoverdin transport system ATP-binding/permease protein